MLRKIKSTQQRYWFPAIIWMVILFVASATPSSQIAQYGPWDLFIKKGGHFLGYSLLGLAYMLGLKNQGYRNWWLAWIMASLYAVTDEMHQVYTPGRHPSPVDVIIDSLGACTGAFLFTRIWMKKLISLSKAG